MSDEKDIWERQDGEPNNWYSRFVIFLQMGPSRSLLGSINLEKAQKGLEKLNYVSQSWREAAKQWDWRERAEMWDEYRRKQVFVQGNAYDVNRVEKLNKYTEMLEAEIDKMLDALAKKKIEKPWFNQFLYEKYLQSLEAIAAETGGRVKRQEITGKDGAPFQTILCLPDNGDEDNESGKEDVQ